jgi:hypothetical protein
MGLFGKCQACKAKDEELRWLRHEMEQMRKTMTEAFKPGLSRTVEEPVRKEVTPIPRAAPEPAKPSFPGYEPYEPPWKAEVVDEN